MDELQFTVKNIKCGGCVNNIRQGLAKLEGVQEVDVVQTSGLVTVRGSQLARDRVSAELARLGYPEA